MGCRTAFYQQEDNPTENQGGGDNQRCGILRKQGLFDEITQQEAENTRRNRRHNHAEPEPLDAAIRCDSACLPPEVFAVKADDRDDGTDLDENLECPAQAVGHFRVEQCGEHQQMAGGGDGQKFGDTFDDAQDDDFDEFVHKLPLTICQPQPGDDCHQTQPVGQ